MPSSVRLCQICYTDDLMHQVPEGAVAFDHRKTSDPQLCEITAFDEAIRRELYKEPDILGLLSPRFIEKTKISMLS